MNVTLVFFKSSGSRKDIPLRAGRYVIGRTPDADLHLPLPSVSRRHCEIVVDDSGPRARDLGSSNGTFLNDMRLTAETPLSPGDTIVIGPCRFAIQINGQPATLKAPDEQRPDLSETPVAPARATSVEPEEDDDATDLDETVARTTTLGGPKGASIEDSSVFDFDFDFDDEDAPKL